MFVKDNLLIITNIKKTILRLEKMMDNFSRNESVLKNSMKEEMYSLLRNAFMANSFKDEKRIEYQKDMLVNVKMLDFYVNTAHHKKFISYNQYTSVGNHLLEILVLIQGWIRSEKTKQPVS